MSLKPFLHANCSNRIDESRMGVVEAVDQAPNYRIREFFVTRQFAIEIALDRRPYLPQEVEIGLVKVAAQVARRAEGPGGRRW